MTQIPEQLGVDGRLIPKPKLYSPGTATEVLRGVGRVCVSGTIFLMAPSLHKA